MCGICGFFYKDVRRSCSVETLNRMVDIMEHRGPDGRGIFSKHGGALGHRRLTIIDLVGGQQPMQLPDEQSALVFNGEIYNYLELRTQYLSDFTLNSTSDTEVLLYILKKKGSDGIRLLNGMFAFAYWDMQNNKVILARDPVGQKPLFYYLGPESFVFASELSSLACHPDVPLDIDTTALAYYLLFEGFPHPFTPLQGVHKLSPGYYMVLDLKQWTLQVARYWNNPPIPSVFNAHDENRYIESFEEIFLQAVKRHLRADVDVGIYLSGGLDSPSLVKAAAEILGGGAVKTFTIKHELDSFDEAVAARETADYFGTKHHERLLYKEDFLRDIDPLLRKNDEPIADPGFLAIYQVAKFSREYVKVILSGNGGDEFYAGYAPFQALGAYRACNRVLPGWLVTFLKKLTAVPRASHDYMNLSFKIQRFLRGACSPPPEVLMQWIGSFNQQELQTILHHDLTHILSPRDQRGHPMLYSTLYDEYEQLEQPDIFTTITHMFQQFYLPVCICNHSDKASMRVSQELRSPFLDTELMQFSNRMPSQMKYQKGKTKYILRKYHEKNSPPGVSLRPKQGFTIPLASWLTTALKAWANEILDPVQMKRDGFFNVQAVRTLWDEHQQRKANHAKQLWTIIVFQHWLYTVWQGWHTAKTP